MNSRNGFFSSSSFVKFPPENITRSSEFISGDPYLGYHASIALSLMSKRLLGRCFGRVLETSPFTSWKNLPPDACPPVSQHIWFPSSISIFSSIFVFISFTSPSSFSLPPPSFSLCLFLLSSLGGRECTLLFKDLYPQTTFPQNFDLQPQLLMALMLCPCHVFCLSFITFRINMVIILQISVMLHNA